MNRGSGMREGTTVAGRWRIDARIGAGAMGTVYAVTHAVDGRRGALKVLHAEHSRDPSLRGRFLREGRVANTIDHPGVVRVEDDGITEDGLAFLVLELLDGETIEERRVRLGGALPLEEVLDTADQVLGALAAAHEKHVVHRDVKPENFFLCHDGAVKLLDFGLARIEATGDEETHVGVMIGTPAFIPPEQALGRRDAIDARSDVWGMGATMFNAITGEYVHDAPTLHEQLRAHATERARSLRSLAPFVPAPVAAVIDRALELESADRWQSARAMQVALREARASAAADFAESVTVMRVAPSVASTRTPPGAPASSEPVSSPVSSAPVTPAPTTARMAPPAMAAPSLPPQPLAAPPSPARRTSTWAVTRAVLIVVVSAVVGALFAWRYLYER